MMAIGIWEMGDGDWELGRIQNNAKAGLKL